MCVADGSQALRAERTTSKENEMTSRSARMFRISWVFVLPMTIACKDESAVQRVAPASASSSQPASAGALRFAVAEKGTATFLIDAPLERIKGRSGKLRVEISVDPSDLTMTRG